MDANLPVHLGRRVIASIVLIAVVVFVGFMGFTKLAGMREDSARSPGAVPPPLVRRGVAKRADYQEKLRGYGRTQAIRRNRISAEVAVIVTWVSPAIEAGTAIDFDPPPRTNGDAPKGGEPAAGPKAVRIDDRDLLDLHARALAEKAAVESDIRRLETLHTSIEARLEVATEEREVAMREYERVADLVRKKRLGKSEGDRERLKVTLRERVLLELQWSDAETEESLKEAKERLKARGNDVALAARNLTRATIYVPFPGRVEERHVNRGDRVNVGSPLFDIVDLSKVEAPIALPGGRYDDVNVGSHVTLRSAQDRRELWTGTVARKAPRISESDRTFFVYVEIEGDAISNPVAAGMYVVADVDGKTHEGVIPVPREALVGEDLFIVESRVVDGKDDGFVARRVRPEIVRMLSGVALVRAGLEDGARYVLTNLESIADGSVIRIAEDEEAREATK